MLALPCCRVLELLLHYGSDVNLVGRNNNESAFAMLIVYTLKVRVGKNLHFIANF